MSDYEDYDYNEDGYGEGGYDEGDAGEAEDIETTVELQFLEIEDMIRKGQLGQALGELDTLYATAKEHNLKNYKIKILLELVQINIKQGKMEELKRTVDRLKELNSEEPLTENTVKTVVTILRGGNYRQTRECLLNFLAKLPVSLQLKSILKLLGRAIEEKDKADAQHMFGRVQEMIEAGEEPPASVLLELYSLEVRYSRLMGINIGERVREMELKMAELEEEAYMSEGHVPVLKLAFAEIMYEAGNYENSSIYLADAFVEKAKYGENKDLKGILKTNALMSLLADPEVRKNERFNSLYHEASTPFKPEQDIQALVGAFEAYERADLVQFEHFFKASEFKAPSPQYETLHRTLLLQPQATPVTGPAPVLLSCPSQLPGPAAGGD